MFDLTSLGNSVWLMEENRLAAMLRVVRERPQITPRQIEHARRAAAGRALRKHAGDVAVIHVGGIIEQRMTGLGAMFGGTPCDMIHDALDACMGAKDIGAVIMEF